MLKELSIFTIPYKGFLKYLYREVFKGDKASFERGIRKLNQNTLIIRALEYLEQEHNVPVLDALVFYSYKYPKEPVVKKLYFTITQEFKRIHENKTTNYIPF